MLNLRLDDDELLRLDVFESVEKYDIKKDNLNLKSSDILFIMDSSEETWLFTKNIKLYMRNKFDKSITNEDIFNIIPEFKNSYNSQINFKAINLGLGHTLFIRAQIFDDYMILLKKDIVYEDECNPEHVYAAWNHWMDCAIRFIRSDNFNI